MLDFGAGEFVVVGVVALIAIGPKELPSVLRAIGRSVGKMRRMAGDFQNQFNDAMREMELEEARKKMEEMSKSVSDSVQEATHINLPTVDLPTLDLTTPAQTDNQSQTPASNAVAETSVLGAIPDIHAPSSESLLAQAQSEAQSLASQAATHSETNIPEVKTVETTSAQPQSEQPAKSSDKNGTGGVA